MTQRFESDLRKFHELFMGGRCAGWQQEELLVAAIKSDTRAQHQVFWVEAGHDDKADIRVRTNGEIHAIEIKSGSLKKDNLVLSGHRLGRFHGDLQKITQYLNQKTADIISIPHEQIDDEQGRRHIYRLRYVDVRTLTSLKPDAWEKKGTSWIQENDHGVISSLRTSMSWQIWWTIPLEIVEEGREIVIG